MRKLYEDREVLLKDAQEAIKFFEEISISDVWQPSYTKELRAIPLENLPIVISQIRAREGISIEVSDEALMECMQDFGLGLKVPFANGYLCYPIGDTAYSTLLQRAGFQSASVLSCQKDRVSQKTMSPENKAKILNMGFECFQNKALVLIRDEKVRAVLSGDEADYSILPFDELVDEFWNGLSSQFQSVSFIRATAGHDVFTYFVEMQDSGIEKQLANILNKCDRYTNDLKIACMLSSSDVGISGANLYPYIYVDGVYRMFAQPICLTHKHRHSIKDFGDNVQKVFSLFKDMETKLDEMSQKKLSHPKGCLLRICKQVGLPKKLSCEMAEEFENLFVNPTQLDLHWELYEVLDRHENDSQKTLSQSYKLNIEENIARIVFSNMDNYDMPFEWE